MDFFSTAKSKPLLKGSSKLSAVACGGYDDVDWAGRALASLPKNFVANDGKRPVTVEVRARGKLQMVLTSGILAVNSFSFDSDDCAPFASEKLLTVSITSEIELARRAEVLDPLA
jgi:hypothetical protein